MFGYQPNLLNAIANLAEIYPIDKEKYDGTRLEVCNGYTLADWAVSGVSADTINTYEDNPTLKLVSTGAGSPYAIRILPSAIDLSSYDYIEIMLYLADFTTGNIYLRIRTNSTNYYEALLGDYYKPDYMTLSPGWKKIRIPKDVFVATGSPDWANVASVYFAPSYNAGVSGYVSLAKVVAVDIPKALISINFDDGLASVYDTAYPIMQAQGLVGSVYVNTSTVGQSNYLTWAQLRELRDAGWLIGSHCHTHADLTTLTVSQIITEFERSQKYLREHGLIIGSNFLATPYGSMNETVMAEVKKRFIGARYGLPSDSIIPPVTPYRMHYLSAINTDTVDALETITDDTITNKRWHMFTFHDILTVAGSSTQYATADFTDFVGRVKTKVDAGTIEVVTPLDVILQVDGSVVDNMASGVKVLLNSIRNM